MSHNHPKVLRAFSMLELVIVITIVGIVATIALPKFADAGSGRRLSASKNTLLADIEMAKLRARATSKIHVIKFYTDENKYIVFEGTDLNRNAVVLTRDFDDDPYAVDLNRTNLSVESNAVITVYGQVSPSFTVGILENGIEISVEIGGVADVGATVTDSISAADVKTASASEVLSKAGK